MSDDFDRYTPHKFVPDDRPLHSAETEAVARAICLAMDGDPDDTRATGLPMWRHKWIIEAANGAIKALDEVRKKSSLLPVP